MVKLKVAVIGHGHLGKWHCEKAQSSDLTTLEYIVESNEDSWPLIKKKYPDLNILKSHHQLKGKIDAAIVATPTFTHAVLVTDLLKMGIHVFCEKPLCLSSNEAHELENLARKNKLLLQVGHSERFHQCFDDFTLFNEFLNARPFIRMERSAAFKGRALDVSVVSDLMIHDVDLMLKLVKSFPTSVTANGFKTITNHEDFVHAFFDFSDGRKVEIVASRMSTNETRMIEVVSQNGTIFFDLIQGHYQLGRLNNESKNWEVSTFAYAKRDHLMIEQEYFFTSILKCLPPAVSATEARDVIFLLEKIEESLLSKGPVSCQK